MTCCKALGSKKGVANTSFLEYKDRGNLFKPSKDVIMVCEETEKCFQRMLSVTQGKLPRCKGMSGVIQTAVLQNVSTKVFPELLEHMLECAIEDNHVHNLIKLIAKSYAKIRFYHLGDVKSNEVSSSKIRKLLTKLVLFKNQ